MKFEGRIPAENVNVTPTHPLQELVLLLSGLAALVVVLVLAVALAVDHLVPLLPPDLEVRWFGGGLRDEIPADPRVAQVQAVLDRVASHWPGNPYAFKAAILEEASPNALAFPGGWIFVTRGLLEQTESENELALVLGHEIGHYAGRDHLRGLGRGVALALVFGALGAGESTAAAGLAGLAGDLTNRGFDRDQEAEADAFGLALMQAEYGHVAGATDFFRKLPEHGGVMGELAGYLSTHPVSADRIEDLEALAREKGWQLEGALAPFVVAVPERSCAEVDD